MREILFRGKRCDNGEWVQGYYIRADHHWHRHGIHKEWIVCGASANGGWFALHNKYAVKAETVGQFTGFPDDKNGKKVFEGDICRVCLDPEICVGAVEYDERTASFIIKVGKTEMLTFLDYMIAHKKVGDAVWFEVIGNIHDNPELLEGEENGD